MLNRSLPACALALLLVGSSSIARAAVECPSTYPNGTALRYANGTINYPNGTTFRYANGALNYPNGVVLRFTNGALQRSNGMSLRAAGGRFEGSAFPSDRDFNMEVSGGGTLHVKVGNTPEEDRFTLTLPVNDKDFVRVELSGTTAPICTAFSRAEVEQASEREFSVHTDAANIDVHVKAGYDPKAVRKALKKALEALDRDE